LNRPRKADTQTNEQRYGGVENVENLARKKKKVGKKKSKKNDPNTSHGNPKRADPPDPFLSGKKKFERKRQKGGRMFARFMPVKANDTPQPNRPGAKKGNPPNSPCKNQNWRKIGKSPAMDLKRERKVEQGGPLRGKEGKFPRGEGLHRLHGVKVDDGKGTSKKKKLEKVF